MPTKRVLYHRYKQKVDLSGKDLISLLGKPVASVERLVGDLVPPETMKEIEVPEEQVTSMTGEVADHVHEWPNARLGRDFKHLSLQFKNGALCSLVWGFDLSDFLPGERKSEPRKRSLAGLLNPKNWF